jgi:hypothetical protein
MFVVFIILVGAVGSALVGPQARRRWQLRTVVACFLVVTVAAGIGMVTRGAAWGFPLADVIWWFDVLVLLEELVALLLAIPLGTPGCEIGVWTELLDRARGRVATADQFLACIVGLHLIDEWEARRRSPVSRPGSA